MSTQYIKGIFSGKYEGEDLNVQTTATKKYHSIDLYEGTVTGAEYIEKYDFLGMTDEHSFEPEYLGGIKIKFTDGTAQQVNLTNVIIQSVQLHETVSREGKTYGGLTGVIYGKIDNLVRSDQRGGQTKDTLVGKSGFRGGFFDGTGGCLGIILKLLGLFLLLYLLWCFLFGKCSCQHPCPECPPCGENVPPRPTVNDTLRRVVIIDTVYVRDSLRLSPTIDTIRRQVVIYDTVEVDDRGLGTGEMQMSLFWQNNDDLDLVVRTPNGWIYFGNKQNGGGVMDLDINANNPLTNSPIENIFWKNAPPKGKYEVYALYFKKHKQDNTPVPFTLKLKYKGREQIFTGNVSKPCNCASGRIPESVPNGGNSVKITEFEVGKGEYMQARTINK
ncbi:hypothetical protein [Runella limosa]|uniref:hypothetical protein n=1 Tax=Runella limosa TaxID=370978 RepID=UPI0003F547AC|nr:hypothetical protein [Runella limosa]